MKTLLWILMFALVTGVLNGVLCWLLGLESNSPWFPLYMIWCGSSGTLAGILAVVTAPERKDHHV